MKKFIFSLIFLVSTLFSFGQFQNFDDTNFFTISDQNSVYTSTSTESTFYTTTAGMGVNVSITFNQVIDFISFNYRFLSPGVFKVNNIAISDADTFFSVINSNQTITFNIKSLTSNSAAELNMYNIKIYSNGQSVGIKNLEKRQLNLFTYNSKIKVNGQIDEKLKLNVFNILGQLVIQTDLKNEIETNVSTGVYILQVLDEHDNSIETKKVLLQN